MELPATGFQRNPTSSCQPPAYTFQAEMGGRAGLRSNRPVIAEAGGWRLEAGGWRLIAEGFLSAQQLPQIRSRAAEPDVEVAEQCVHRAHLIKAHFINQLLEDQGIV